jgi:NAD(P)H-dependent FMN reductase
VDIAAFGLPLLDGAVPPSLNQYSKPHTKAWAAKIASFDAFVFVTPKYNHATSGALKNAIDFLFREWNDKAAGFVGYGSVGGARAVEHLRLVMGEIKVADVRTRVVLSLFTDFTGNIAEKYLELLFAAAPKVKRVGVLGDSTPAFVASENEAQTEALRRSAAQY